MLRARRVAETLAEPHHLVESHDEALGLDGLPYCQQHTGHEALTAHRVVAQSKGLTSGTEYDLVVSHAARHTATVNGYAFEVTASGDGLSPPLRE